MTNTIAHFDVLRYQITECIYKNPSYKINTFSDFVSSEFFKCESKLLDPYQLLKNHISELSYTVCHIAMLHKEQVIL